MCMNVKVFFMYCLKLFMKLFIVLIFEYNKELKFRCIDRICRFYLLKLLVKNSKDISNIKYNSILWYFMFIM